jgi:hypothetical protein
LLDSVDLSCRFDRQLAKAHRFLAAPNTSANIGGKRALSQCKPSVYSLPFSEANYT